MGEGPTITGKEEDVEVALTYFGKRFHNAALQRWVSADPLEVHQPGNADSNLYAYVSGQPLKVVDPLGLDGASDAEAAARAAGEAASASSAATHRMMHGGLVLEVVGGGDATTELKDLQSLTDDRLTVVENGTNEASRIRRFTVGIQENGEGDKSKGTELVRRLIMNEHRTEVRQTGTAKGSFTVDAGRGSGYQENGTPGSGTSQSVRYGRFSGPNDDGSLVQDQQTGVVSKEPWTPGIVFGHELIHADRGTHGLKVHGPPRGMPCGAEVAGCTTSRYRDERGRTWEQDLRVEEAVTTGLIQVGQQVTENDLRAEQGLPLRIRY